MRHPVDVAPRNPGTQPGDVSIEAGPQARILNMIPAAKSGYDFLASSHYKLGYDSREIPDAMQSLTTIHFKGRNPEHLKPCCDPDPAVFAHADKRFFSDKLSETQKEFGRKKVEEPNPPPGDKGGFLATNFKIGDEVKREGVEDQKLPATTNREFFGAKSLKDSNPIRFRPHALDSNLIEIGDRDALPQPDSDYKGNFRDPQCGADPRAPPHHLLHTKTLDGDARSHGPRTTAANEHFEYRQGGRPPAFPSKHHGTNIPMGDAEKQNDKVTLFGGSYQGHPNNALAATYDKPETVAAVYLSNFSCGDPASYETNYTSISNDSYMRRKRLPPVPRVGPLHLLKSSLPEGPMNPERFETTTEKFHDHQGIYKNKIVDGGDYMTVSNVNVGDNAQGSKFYETTTRHTYQPKYEPFPERADLGLGTASKVPMDYYKKTPLPPSTNTETYGRLRPREKYNEVVHNDLQTSHVRFPLASDVSYSTEALEQFGGKTGRKQKTNRHRHWKSSVPIGTFQKFIDY